MTVEELIAQLGRFDRNFLVSFAHPECDREISGVEEESECVVELSDGGIEISRHIRLC